MTPLALVSGRRYPAAMEDASPFADWDRFFPTDVPPLALVVTGHAHHRTVRVPAATADARALVVTLALGVGSECTSYRAVWPEDEAPTPTADLHRWPHPLPASFYQASRTAAFRVGRVRWMPRTELEPRALLVSRATGAVVTIDDENVFVVLGTVDDAHALRGLLRLLGADDATTEAPRDPRAELEARKAELERQLAERKAAEARREQEIESELAALKKKIE